MNVCLLTRMALDFEIEIPLKLLSEIGMRDIQEMPFSTPALFYRLCFFFCVFSSLNRFMVELTRFSKSSVPYRPGQKR